MTSHFLLMLLFAFFVALVFAVLMKDQPRDQVRFGVIVFGGFIVSALVLGWLMYPCPSDDLQSGPVDQHRASSWAGRNGRLSLWGPVVLYCLLIFGLSSVSSVPSLPGGMSDKLAHALLYSGLGFLVTRAASGGLGHGPSLRVALVVLAFSAFYGLSDEFHQLFVPNRQFDPKDMAADVIGGALGMGALWLWSILRRNRDAL